MNSTDTTLVLRPREVARLLRTRYDRVLALIRSGAIPSIEIGDRRLVPRAAFERWLIEEAEKRSG